MRKIFTLLLILTALCTQMRGETLWGYYMGSTIKGTGTGYEGTYQVCMYIPGTGALQGQSIVAFNLPCKTRLMENVSIWAGSEKGDKSLLNQQCPNLLIPADETYVRVDLAAPVAIPAEGMYVGYTFDVEPEEGQALTLFQQNPVGIARTDAAPFSGPIANSLWVMPPYYSTWEDWSSVRTSALQLYLEGGKTYTHYVKPESASMQPIVAGTQAEAEVALSSYSTQAVSQVKYTLTTRKADQAEGGAATTATYTFTPAIAAGSNTPATMHLTFTAPAKAGRYKATLSITEVDGQPNEAASEALEFDLSVLSRAEKRLSVVEEVTGTGCSWCPGGLVMMEKIRETMPEKAVVIGVHWFNNYSPMYVPDYDESAIPTSMAPLCMVDRRTPLFDPYAGHEGKQAPAWVSLINQQLPEVAMSVQAEYGTTGIEATATTEFLTDLPGAQIAYVLTADGLTGPGTQWMQNNAYAGASASQYPGMDDFCAGGKYDANPVTIIYNDVMIASSWQKDATAPSSARTNCAPAFTSTQAGHREALTFNLALPSKDVLLRAVQYNQLYVTAFVITADGHIANTARCRVEGEPVGVVSPTGSPSKSVAGTTYDLQGRKMAGKCSPYRDFNHGLTIQNGHLILR